MTVRLGNIELTRLQSVEVDEGRNLVEHQLPGASGSLFQDLGRGSLRLTLRGLLLGEPALIEIETLRSAHAEAKPLPFAADIAVGSELTDVLVEEFAVHQLPGYQFRYEFLLKLKEWTEPPEPAAAAIAAVEAEVATDAKARIDEAVAIGGALDNPGALVSLIEGDPGFLSRIDKAELARAVLNARGGLDGAGFAQLASALTGVDVEKFVGLIEALSEADGLADLFEILTQDGINLLEDLVGIDLSGASALVQAFVGGPEFLRALRNVTSAADDLRKSVSQLDPLLGLGDYQNGPTHE